VFRALGAVLSDVALPSLSDFQACGLLILLAEAFGVHEPWIRTRFNDYGELLRNRLAIAGVVTGVDYVQALRRRRELCAQTAEAMADVDILITAAQPGEALPIDALPPWGLFEQPAFSMPFNVTGLPALSVCSGFGVGGLPVAIQLVGKPFADATVLCAGHAFERATAWRSRRPMVSREAVSA